MKQPGETTLKRRSPEQNTAHIDLFARYQTIRSALKARPIDISQKRKLLKDLNDQFQASKANIDASNAVLDRFEQEHLEREKVRSPEVLRAEEAALKLAEDQRAMVEAEGRKTIARVEAERDPEALAEVQALNKATYEKINEKIRDLKEALRKAKTSIEDLPIDPEFEKEIYEEEKRNHDPIYDVLRTHLNIPTLQGGVRYRVITGFEEGRINREVFKNYHDFLRWYKSVPLEVHEAIAVEAKRRKVLPIKVNPPLENEEGARSALKAAEKDQRDEIMAAITLIQEHPLHIKDAYADAVRKGKIERREESQEKPIPQAIPEELDVEKELGSARAPQETPEADLAALLEEQSKDDPVPETPPVPESEPVITALAPRRRKRVEVNSSVPKALASGNPSPEIDEAEARLAEEIADAESIWALCYALEKVKFIMTSEIPLSTTDLTLEIRKLENHVAQGGDVSNEMLLVLPRSYGLRKKTAVLLEQLRQHLREEEQVAAVADHPIRESAPTEEEEAPKASGGVRAWFRSINPFTRKPKPPRSTDETPPAPRAVPELATSPEELSLDDARMVYAKANAAFEGLHSLFRKKGVDANEVLEAARDKILASFDRGEKLTTEELYGHLKGLGAWGETGESDAGIVDTLLDLATARFKYERARIALAEKMADEQSGRMAIYNRVIITEHELLQQAKIDGFPPKERGKVMKMMKQGLDWWRTLTPTQQRAITAGLLIVGMVGAGYAGTVAVGAGAFRFAKSSIAAGAGGAALKGFDAVSKRYGFDTSSLEERSQQIVAEEFADYQLSREGLNELEKIYAQEVKQLAFEKSTIKILKTTIALTASFGTGIGLGMLGHSITETGSGTTSPRPVPTPSVSPSPETSGSSASEQVSKATPPSALREVPPRPLPALERTPGLNQQLIDATVGEKEGMWHAIHRQLATRYAGMSHTEVQEKLEFKATDATYEAKLAEALNERTGKILADQEHIRAGGVNDWVRKPGTKVFLNADDSISVDKSALIEHRPTGTAVAAGERQIEPFDGESSDPVEPPNLESAPQPISLNSLSEHPGSYIKTVPEGEPFLGNAENAVSTAKENLRETLRVNGYGQSNETLRALDVSLNSPRVHDLMQHVGFEGDLGRTAFEDFSIRTLSEEIPTVEEAERLAGLGRTITFTGSNGAAFRLLPTKDLGILLKAADETIRAHGIPDGDRAYITFGSLFEKYGNELLGNYDKLKKQY